MGIYGYFNYLSNLESGLFFSGFNDFFLNPFEEKRDFFATSILAESTNLQFDSEGRISISLKLLKHAKIKNSMLFVGQGQTFQIWEPTAFEKFKVSARKKANLNRASLKWEKHLNNQEGN